MTCGQETEQVYSFSQSLHEVGSEKASVWLAPLLVIESHLLMSTQEAFNRTVHDVKGIFK